MTIKLIDTDSLKEIAKDHPRAAIVNELVNRYTGALDLLFGKLQSEDHSAESANASFGALTAVAAKHAAWFCVCANLNEEQTKEVVESCCTAFRINFEEHLKIARQKQVDFYREKGEIN